MLPILSLNRLASQLCCRDTWANVFFYFTTGKYCVHSFSFVNCLAFFPAKYSSYSITYLWILHSCQSPGLHFRFTPKSNISLNTCFAGNPTEFLSAECCLYTSACSRVHTHTHWHSTRKNALRLWLWWEIGSKMMCILTIQSPWLEIENILSSALSCLPV